jgi:hypothetical protein
MEEFEWQKKRKSRRLSLQKMKMLLPAVSPQRKILLKIRKSRNSPAHTSRGMQIQLLDIMSRSLSSQNLLMVL